MQRLVVDASALLLVGQRQDADPRAELARAALGEASGRFSVAAPALLGWEMGDLIFVKRATEWPGAALAGDHLMRLLADVDLIAASPEELSRTGALARRHALSFYDAAYLELAARAQDSWLVTEDDRLLRAARREIGKPRAHDLASLAKAVED